jgi:hypothetical protein
MRTDNYRFLGLAGKSSKQLAGIFTTYICGNLQGCPMSVSTCVSKRIVLLRTQIYTWDEIVLSKMGVVVSLQCFARDVKRRD